MMGNERWSQIEHLFHVALECPMNEREAWLAKSCEGDEALRQEVQSLLAAHEHPNGVLSAPAADLAVDWMEQQAAAQSQPATLIGQQLRHYKILSVLGKGGMGEVYLAEDTNLDRRVALKLLPVDLTTDAARVRRFVREAKAASALNHPNIITIHEIGQAMDEQGALHFLVTEYIEGETLRDRLSRERLSLQSVLDIAIQIAGALSVAHEAGIIHRDIKPENVMLRKDGIVKVLDFGLAKLTERRREEEKERQREASFSLSLPPSFSTIPGIVMGTAHYMSPEQVRGQAVDVRTDIFSFGVLLYEMIAGRPPFEGVNAIEVMGAILHQELPPLRPSLQEFPAELQEGVEQTIRQALRKDRTERTPTIEALRNELKEIQCDFETHLFHRPPSSLSPMPTTQQKAVPTDEALDTPTIALRPSLFRWLQQSNLALILLLVISVLIGTTAYYWLGKGRAKGSDAPFVPVPFTGLPGLEYHAAFSPDGKQVAFSWEGGTGGSSNIYVKLIGVGEPVQLTRDPAEDGFPVWSPDGRFIAFQRRKQDKQDIFIVPALGGPERFLSTVDAPKIAWSPDGKWLAAGIKPEGGKDLAINLIAVETGEKRPLTQPPSTFSDSGPAFSPNGQLIVFVRASISTADELYLISSQGGDAHQLTTGSRRISGADWTADGREIICSSTRAGKQTLWRLPVTGGEPVALPGVGWDVVWPTLSRQGNMLAFTENYQGNNILRLELPSPRAGKQTTGMFTPLIATKRGEDSPQISPDGTKIAFISSRSGSSEIWLCDRDGTNPRQLTQMRQAEAGSPRWSPDSQQLVFDARPDLSGDLFVVNAAGGPARRLTTESSHDVIPSWSSDGKWIYFCSNRSGSFQIWKLPATGGSAVQMTQQGGLEAFESPDGKTLYYSKWRGVDGLWAVPSAGGMGQPVPELAEAGYWRAWSVMPEGIYYVAHTSSTPPYPLKFFNFATRQTKQVGLVEKTPPWYVGSLTAAPDGQWLLYAQPDRLVSTLMLVENFR